MHHSLDPGIVYRHCQGSPPRLAAKAHCQGAKPLCLHCQVEGALQNHTVERLSAGAHHVSVLATPGPPRGDLPAGDAPGQDGGARDGFAATRSHSATLTTRDVIAVAAPTAVPVGAERGGRGNFAPIGHQLAQVCPQPRHAPLNQLSNSAWMLDQVVVSNGLYDLFDL